MHGSRRPSSIALPAPAVDASRRAFHKPFAAVDKECVAWIRATA